MRSYATLHSRTPFRLMDSSAVWQRRANNGRPTGEQEEQVPAKRVAIPVFLFLASRQYLHTTLLLKATAHEPSPCCARADHAAGGCDHSAGGNWRRGPRAGHADSVDRDPGART